jgi:hypothetical protein
MVDSIAEMMFGAEYNKKRKRYLSKQASFLNNGG